MSVTSGPSILPPASAPQTGKPARPTTADPSPGPVAETAHAPARAPDVPNPPAPATTAIGFSLSYDPATDRMILEAREPRSGFVIFQMPPKYVIKQFTASVGAIEPARGARLNGAA